MKKGIVVALLCSTIAYSGYQVVGQEKAEAATGHWGENTLKQLQERGWIESSDRLPWSYSQQASRSEVAVLLGKALKLKKESGETLFGDVTGEEKEYLNELVERGVFDQTAQFHPDSPVTRGQTAKIITQAFELTGMGASGSGFEDVKGWEKPYVDILHHHKLTTGKTPVLYGPKDTLTRMQLYAFLDRAFVQQEITHDTHVVKQVVIETKEEWNRMLNATYTELPDEVAIQTQLKKAVLSEWLDEWEKKTHPQNSLNRWTLASYHLENIGKTLYLKDRSHDKLSAKQVEDGVRFFASEWADGMVGASDIEKVRGIYDYLYENYRYQAHGYKTMYVGNMWSDTLACNGFSRLAYEMATAAGLEAHIVMGEDHLWNYLVVDGKRMLFDVTSDIYMQKPFWTLGMSSEEHKQALGNIGIYGGSFDYSRYSILDTQQSIADQVKLYEKRSNL